MNNENEDLIKRADIQKIATEGARIYAKFKIKYEPKENGKFLAIDIDSENTYLGNTSADALELAKQHHPKKVFYVVQVRL